MFNPAISNPETTWDVQNVPNTDQTQAAAAESAADKRKRISRENGSKSKGPITPEGKAISSRNARKFGLRTENVLPETRNCESYRNIQDGFIAEFQPVSSAEIRAIDRMATYAFQLQVIWELRTALSNDSIAEARKELHKIRQRNPVITLNAIENALNDSDSALKQFAGNEVRYDQMYRRALNDIQLHIQTRSLPPGVLEPRGPNEPRLAAAINQSPVSAPNESGSGEATTNPSLTPAPNEPTSPGPPVTPPRGSAPNEPGSAETTTNPSVSPAPNEPGNPPATNQSLTPAPNKPTSPVLPVNPSRGGAPNEPGSAAATNQSPISAPNKPTLAPPVTALLCPAPNEPASESSITPSLPPAPNEPGLAETPSTAPIKPTAHANPNLDILQSILAALDHFPEAKLQILNAIDALQPPSPISKSAGN